jgi:hypothetical protein
MSVNKLNPIEYWYGSCKKEIGQVFTSEEHRHRGLEYRKPYFNTEVTRDCITHFIDGIGDLNPLYRDPDYGKKTKYKCLVAPPVFSYSITYAQYPDTWPEGISGFYSGSDREWFRPFCEGDKVDYRVMYPSDVVLMASKFSGQKVMTYELCDYYRGGAIIGGYRCWETWAENRKADEQKKYKTEVAALPVYTKEDLKNIYAAQDKEVEMLRGANPRYWEDVNVSDELTPVVRGPFTLTEKEAWDMGCHGNVHFSDRLTRIWHERDPHHTIDYDPTFSQPQTIRPGYLIRFAAGENVEAWRAMALTNWMGDDGFLWKSSTQIRKFTMLGDTIWSKGKVTKKYCDNGKYCVDIDCWCENQRKELVIPGTATIILPSREQGPVVYPEPCPRVP